MKRLDLHTAEPGVYAIRSASDTVYLLDLLGQPAVMRLTGPRTHSRMWWDDQWAPLTQVLSRPDGGPVQPGVIHVGSRTKYVADPGGSADPNEHFWYSRIVTSIERLTECQRRSKSEPVPTVEK
jgi:hypothetical protein